MNGFIGFVFISLLLLSFSDLVFSKQLPVYLRNLRCSRTEKFDECFKINGNKAIPLVVKGDPEFGISNMVPLKLPFINFISSPTLSINLTKVEVHGLDKMKITNHTTDIATGLFTLFLHCDNVTIVGDYIADGRILVMPINGQGRFSVYFKNGQYKSMNTVKTEKRGGEEYFKLADSRFKASFENVVFNLENLFKGNKQLGDQVNTFLNENWKDIVEDFSPSLERTISGMINRIFNIFTAVVIVKDLFV